MIDQLARTAIENWLHSDRVYTDETFLVSEAEQRLNEARMEQFRRDVPAYLRSIPASDRNYKAQRDNLFNMLIAFEAQLLPEEKQRLPWLLEFGFADAAADFIRQAQRFDDKLTQAEINQAFRNVLIMNSLQVIAQRPLEITPAIFAFSLLYPYSDNYLDDPAVSTEDKLAFNDKFRRWISGQPAKATGHRENKIRQLLEMITAYYDRNAYASVYASLLAIQSAQEKSLHQQDIAGKDVLAISVEKGGTSVLADAYLVLGSLTASEAQFVFDYGVFLQFIDDLQDIEEDAAAGHSTIFTVADPSETLDARVSRLYQFIANFGQRNPFANEQAEEFLTLIRASCSGLIDEAIAQHEHRFSTQFCQEQEKHSLFKLSYLKTLRSRHDHLSDLELSRLTRILTNG